VLVQQLLLLEVLVGLQERQLAESQGQLLEVLVGLQERQLVELQGQLVKKLVQPIRQLAVVEQLAEQLVAVELLAIVVLKVVARLLEYFH